MELEGSYNSPPSVPILNQIYSVYTHPSSWFILKLSSHLSLGLPGDIIPSRLPTKTLYAPLLSP